MVDPPPDAEVLDQLLQFRIQQDAVGRVERYKTRACARGDWQTFMINYTETSAPVATLISCKLFFAIAVKLKMRRRQCDVPSASMKAPLRDVVYVRPLRSFQDDVQQGKVWRLRKALYGLKQAGLGSSE